jgi:hypothetical protein
MRHLTGAVWAKLKPRTDAFRLLGGTSDFLAGIVAAKGKTFVHMKAATGNRHGHRDATMILVAS